MPMFFIFMLLYLMYWQLFYGGSSFILDGFR